MTQILALLNDLLIACQGVRAVLQTVYNLVLHTAQENVPFHITTEVDIIAAVVTDASFGNHQINTNLLGLVTTLTADFDALSAQIAALPQVGDPVVLPTTAPSGYGGPPVGDVTDGVWNKQLSFTTNTTLDAVETAYTFAKRFGYSGGVQAFFDRKFLIVGSGWWNPIGVDPPLITWTADPSHILADDTVLSWLQRETDNDPIWTIDDDGYPVWSDPDNPNWEFVLPWTEDYFDLVKRHYLSSAASGPPVWPGLSGVTLGASVALSTGVTVSGPLQGVLIALTSVPTDKSFFDFDGDLSYRNLGAITFQTDNGDDEFPQSLGFTSAIFTPKTMSAASACLIRTTGGVVGTVTPFTIP